MKTQEAESREKIANEIHLRMAYEKKCRDLEELLEIEERKKKGFE